MDKREREERKDKEPDPIEILSDIDEYQKKMESRWENDRESYQQKIDNILGDFLKQAKETSITDIENESSKSHGALARFFKGGAEKRVDNLFSQAESAMRAIEKKAREFTGKTERTSIVNIDWSTSRAIPVKRGKLVFVFGASILLLAGYFLLRLPTRSPLPYSHTGAVVVDGGNIYISDWFRKTLYTHKAVKGLPIIHIDALPNDFLTGMAFSPDKIWTSNGISAQIQEHTRVEDHPVTLKMDAIGKSPTGLYFDGTDLWSVDDAAKKLVRHRGNDIEEIKEEFQLPNIELSALGFNGNRMWVMSKKSREIHVFRVGEPVKQTAAYDLDPFLNGATPTGFFIDGSRFWVTTENPSQLLKLSLRKVMHTPAAVNEPAN